MSQLVLHAKKLPDQVSELVVQGIPEDESLWVPQAPNVWFRPLLFDTGNGQWVTLLRVRHAGVLSDVSAASREEARRRTKRSRPPNATVDRSVSALPSHARLLNPSSPAS